MRSFSMATPAAKFGSISPLASRLTSRLTPPGPAHPPAAAGELHYDTLHKQNLAAGCTVCDDFMLMVEAAGLGPMLDMMESVQHWLDDFLICKQIKQLRLSI